MLLRATFAALIDLVLPRACAGCGRAGLPLCSACLPAEAPLHSWSGGTDVCAAGAYEGSLRSALIAYKERGRHELSGPLGALLARAVSSAAWPPDAVLVPVPSSSAAARARGGDHVLRLASVAGRGCGLPVVRALSLGRAVADSSGLSRADRAANLRGAMTARPPPSRAGTAVIVDDIVTTGATVREARRALMGAGWSVCGAATVAATPRHAARPLPMARRDGAVYRGHDLTE
ncbi:MAG: ComF family protein [Jatrophihabitantaceae bacterium]